MIIIIKYKIYDYQLSPALSVPFPVQELPFLQLIKKYQIVIKYRFKL